MIQFVWFLHVCRQLGEHRGYSNSQIGAFLAYASPLGRALIERELYLSKEWTSDRARCHAAGIRDREQFATKPVRAGRMPERALQAEVPFGWVTADEALTTTERSG